MNDLDKMTMELFMNKSQYAKYISKTDPKKHEENQQYNDNLERRRDAMMELVAEYCDNPHKQLTTEMDETFRQFARTCFRYFEMKELENTSEDEDMMLTSSALYSKPTQTQTRTTTLQSLWGKGSRKAEELAVSCARSFTDTEE
jgi:hypothetical protein